MASSINIPFNIAILDPFGLLVAFLCQDSAYPGSIDISMDSVPHLFEGIYFSWNPAIFKQRLTFHG